MPCIDESLEWAELGNQEECFSFEIDFLITWSRVCSWTYKHNISVRSRIDGFLYTGERRCCGSVTSRVISSFGDIDDSFSSQRICRALLRRRAADDTRRRIQREPCWQDAAVFQDIGVTGPPAADGEVRGVGGGDFSGG